MAAPDLRSSTNTPTASTAYYRDTYGSDSKQYSVARYTQQHYPMSRFEPSVAEHLLNKLVSAEQNITTLLGHIPTQIDRDGTTLREITLCEYGTNKSITVTGTTYVDATYEGDLAALAQVPYRVGREGHANMKSRTPASCSPTSRGKRP